ncbi:MAG: VOC family protein [Gammaproteobacteria bacterium]
MSPKAWGPIKQLAYVVDDIDAAIARWIALHGVGPWTVYRNTAIKGRCRDAETTVRMHVGLSYQNDLQIELIQPLSDTPSPYRDAQGRALLGMHHIAWHADDLDAAVAQAKARGLAAVFEASTGLVRVAYFEMPGAPGPLYELIEAGTVVREGFDSGLRASRDWDGVSTPVTSIDLGG